jgi:hypothetical protein
MAMKHSVFQIVYERRILAGTVAWADWQQEIRIAVTRRSTHAIMADSTLLAGSTHYRKTLNLQWPK